MRTSLAIFALLFGLLLSAQQKSIVPLPVLPAEASAKAGAPSSAKASADTRAVVIGISNYHDPQIPDLRFADRDAEAFANYLRSPAGGSLDGDHLKVLTNEQATAGQAISALYWLVDECNADDQVIIYFSGHGDVEQKFVGQPGFLLCWDSPAAVYYSGGSLQLGMLQTLIATLSQVNKAEVLVVTDACHAGKLSGSEFGGPKLTNANLASQYADEVKILSCQPNEYSVEGEQWGGGRGAFSYHLEEGLYGLADRNADAIVTVSEVDRYLEDHVTAEVAPERQQPRVIGDKSKKLARVLPDQVAALRQRKSGQGPEFSPTNNRGLEDEVLAGLDSNIQEMYHRFNQTLKEKAFFKPITACAEYYYQRLSVASGLGRLHNAMRRNYAAALMDDAQQVINLVLKSDPLIIDFIYGTTRKFDYIPKCLHRAAELLGEEHYMYRFLKAKEYYFKAKAYRKDNYPELTSDSLSSIALMQLDSALAYDSCAAYAWYEKGRLYEVYKNNQYQGYRCFEKAIELSPNWILALNEYSIDIIGVKKNYEKGLACQFKIMELDSTFLPVYFGIGNTYEVYFNDFKSANLWYERSIDKMRAYILEHPALVPSRYYNVLGLTLNWLGRFEEAEAALELGIDKANVVYYNFYTNLIDAYHGQGKFEEAERMYHKLMSITPEHPSGAPYSAFGRIKFFYQKKPVTEAAVFLNKAIQKEPDYYLHYDVLAFAYMSSGKYDHAAQIIQQWQSMDSFSLFTRLRLGQVLLLQGNNEEAQILFREMLTNTPSRMDLYPAYYFQLAGMLLTEKTDTLPAFIEAERQRSSDLADFYYFTACAYGCARKTTEALFWLNKALQVTKRWMHSPEYILENPDLNFLKELPEFNALLKQHFPKRYQN